MTRKAFVMSVHPGMETEYQRRHNPVWQELLDTLKKHGVHNYSIFLNLETRQLFGYVEIEDEGRWNAVANTPICQKWWKFMGDIMPSNPDHSPVSVALKDEVGLPIHFHTHDTACVSQQAGITAWHISISHTAQIAFASAIAEK